MKTRHNPTMTSKAKDFWNDYTADQNRLLTKTEKFNSNQNGQNFTPNTQNFTQNRFNSNQNRFNSNQNTQNFTPNRFNSNINSPRLSIINPNILDNNFVLRNLTPCSPSIWK